MTHRQPCPGLMDASGPQSTGRQRAGRHRVANTFSSYDLNCPVPSLREVKSSLLRVAWTQWLTFKKVRKTSHFTEERPAEAPNPETMAQVMASSSWWSREAGPRPSRRRAPASRPRSQAAKTRGPESHHRREGHVGTRVVPWGPTYTWKSRCRESRPSQAPPPAPRPRRQAQQALRCLQHTFRKMTQICKNCTSSSWGFPSGPVARACPPVRERRGSPLGREGPQEEEKTAHPVLCLGKRSLWATVHGAAQGPSYQHTKGWGSWETLGLAPSWEGLRLRAPTDSRRVDRQASRAGDKGTRALVSRAALG